MNNFQKTLIFKIHLTTKHFGTTLQGLHLSKRIIFLKDKNKLVDEVLNFRLKVKPVNYIDSTTQKIKQINLHLSLTN